MDSVWILAREFFNNELNESHYDIKVFCCKENAEKGLTEKMESYNYDEETHEWKMIEGSSYKVYFLHDKTKDEDWDDDWDESSYYLPSIGIYKYDVFDSLQNIKPAEKKK